MTDRPLNECIELLLEALDSEDFQPQFSSFQHMTGPALRGTIERALHAAEKAATNPPRPTMRECLERALQDVHVSRGNQPRDEHGLSVMMRIRSKAGTSHFRDDLSGNSWRRDELLRALEIACGEEFDDE